jgi:hypothetical protein
MYESDLLNDTLCNYYNTCYVSGIVTLITDLIIIINSNISAKY